MDYFVTTSFERRFGPPNFEYRVTLPCHQRELLEDGLFKFRGDPTTGIERLTPRPLGDSMCCRGRRGSFQKHRDDGQIRQCPSIHFTHSGYQATAGGPGLERPAMGLEISWFSWPECRETGT